MEQLREAPALTGSGANEPVSEKMPHISKERKNSNALRNYEVNLRFLDQGMIIGVGCKSFAFSSKEDGLAKLNEYLNDPLEIQEFWLQKLGY